MTRSAALGTRSSKRPISIALQQQVYGFETLGVNLPSAQPSRTALITGRHPHELGVMREEVRESLFSEIQQPSRKPQPPPSVLYTISAIG